jgi:hypothetical protein
MKGVIAYLAFLLAAGVAGAIWLDQVNSTSLAPERLTFFACLIAAFGGGLVNCGRAIYLNACVRRKWDRAWHPWYYVRPVLSAMIGVVAFAFIRAGLFVFGGGEVGKGSVWAFVAIAFIAGYNVQRFLEQLEAISELAFGIKKKSTPQEEAAR